MYWQQSNSGWYKVASFELSKGWLANRARGEQTTSGRIHPWWWWWSIFRRTKTFCTSSNSEARDSEKSLRENSTQSSGRIVMAGRCSFYTRFQFMPNGSERAKLISLAIGANLKFSIRLSSELIIKLRSRQNDPAGFECEATITDRTGSVLKLIPLDRIRAQSRFRRLKLERLD